MDLSSIIPWIFPWLSNFRSLASRENIDFFRDHRIIIKQAYHEGVRRLEIISSQNCYFVPRFWKQITRIIGGNSVNGIDKVGFQICCRINEVIMIEVEFDVRE